MGVLCYFTRKRLPSILFTRRSKYFYRVKIICQPLSDILSTLYYLLLKCFHYFRHASLRIWSKENWLRWEVLLTSLNFESRGELFQPAWAASKETVVGLGHKFVDGALHFKIDCFWTLDRQYFTQASNNSTLNSFDSLILIWSFVFCPRQGLPRRAIFSSSVKSSGFLASRTE